MVFVAKIPHQEARRKTWFGYWKDDGFVKSKHQGRGDYKGAWGDIRAQWIDDYRNRTVRAGSSVLAEVAEYDEWCAEAYLQTNYRTLDNKSFANKVKEFVAGKLLSSTSTITLNEKPVINSGFALDFSAWKPFKYGEIFKIINGYYNKKPSDSGNVDDLPFIGATANKNGVTSYANKREVLMTNKEGDPESVPVADSKIFEPNCITVSNNGSVGNAFYQFRPFTCSHDVNILRLINHTFNPGIALFVATVIELEQYRWNYGRKWRPMRMPNSTIFLPTEDSGDPDWSFMERYILSLPYSSSIQG